MMLKRPKTKPPDREEAEAIGLEALTFLAGDDDRLAKFLAITGITPDALVAGARTAPMLAAVLEHLVGDESGLLVFAAEAGMAPERVVQAHALLEGPRA